MYGLTLYQPYAHIVSLGQKLIENRPWEPPPTLLNQDFAIHAGKRWDNEGATTVEALGGFSLGREDVVFGAVTAVVKLVAVVTTEADAERMAPHHGKWFFGKYGWVLEDVRLVFPAVECRGFQKLWNLPPDIEKEVRDRLGN